jgi:hypothetical protein
LGHPEMGDCPATLLPEFAGKLNRHALESARIKIGRRQRQAALAHALYD